MVEEVKIIYELRNPDHHLVLSKLETARDLCPSLGEAWKYSYCSAIALHDKRAETYKSRAIFNGISDVSCGTSVPSMPKPVPGHVRNKYALLIGVSNFKDPQIPHLQFAAKDAKDLDAFLTSRPYGNFRPENVYLLTDADATRANILDRLNRIVLQAREDDLVLIFISSHGSPSQQDNGFKGIGYIVTYDTSLRDIWLDSIEYQNLASKTSLIKARRKAIFLDTCYSGQMKLGEKGLILEEGVASQTANLFLSGEGTYVVTSSKDNERSWESDHLQNGFFTHSLINALQQGTEPPTIHQVFERLSREVPSSVAKEKGASQNPQMLPRDEVEDLRIGVVPTDREDQQ